MIADLLDPDTGWWNRVLVMQHFNHEDGEAILRVPLSRRVIQDSLFWTFTKSGDYTVRSGYQVARELQKEGNWAECSSGVMGGSVWKVLWKLKVPNKIKVFGWRACCNILPTRVNWCTKRLYRITGVRCANLKQKRVYMLSGTVVRRGMFGQGVRLVCRNALVNRVIFFSLWSYLLIAYLLMNLSCSLSKRGSFGTKEMVLFMGRSYSHPRCQSSERKIFWWSFGKPTFNSLPHPIYRVRRDGDHHLWNVIG